MSVEVINLGHGSTVISFDEYQVLVDLPIDHSALRYHSPAFSTDEAQGWLQPTKLNVPSWHRYPGIRGISTIFLSHPEACLALPSFLADVEFLGRIFVSSPTLTQAKFLLENFRAYSLSRTVSNDPNPPVPKDDELFKEWYLNEWLSCFTEADIDHAFSKLDVMDINAPYYLDGHVTVTAVSSGYSVGAFNWLFDWCSTKMLFVGSSSLHKERCPLEMDLSSRVQGPEYIIFPCPLRKQPLDITNTKNVLEGAINTAINRGGHVLFAAESFQMVLDYLEHLVRIMAKMPADKQSPVTVVGFDEEFHYVDRYGEWLSKGFSDKIFDNPPKAPFLWEPLMQRGRLKSLKDKSEIDDTMLSRPSIFVVPDPHLRFDPACCLMEAWAQAAEHLIILPKEIEVVGGVGWPKPPSVVKPYEPVLAQVLYIDTDVRLSVPDIRKVVNEVKPQRIIYAPPLAPGITDPNVLTSTLNEAFSCTADIILPIGMSKLMYERAFFDGAPFQKASVNINMLPTDNSKTDNDGNPYTSFSGVFKYDKRSGWMAKSKANPDYCLYHADKSKSLTTNSLVHAFQIAGKKNAVISGNSVKWEGVTVSLIGPLEVEIDVENEDDRTWVTDLVASFLQPIN